MYECKFPVFTDEKGRDLMNSAADVWQKVLSLMGEEMTSITLNTNITLCVDITLSNLL